MPAIIQAQGLVIKAKPLIPTVGENTLQFTVLDSAGKPAKDPKITLGVFMTNMDMGTAHPEATSVGDGLYEAKVRFGMKGPWRITIEAKTGSLTAKKNIDYAVGKEAPMDMGGMKMGDQMDMSMAGRFGPWSMSREGSGTSWLPESSPMRMLMLPKRGAYDVSAMGFLTFNFSDAGGPRGDSRFYSNSMLMLMANRRTGGGTFGLSLMASLDPIFNGEYGYPDLFQTGETAYGNKLTDYQHPHDLIAEAALSYSHPIGGGANAFIYGGPVGEPALGGPTFMHRPSGVEIPEAPITHHWFDSTHISWGVVTAGISTDRWQWEGSFFNGHEPDENRYSPDNVALNSASTRVTFNPTRNLSLNASYGYLNSPESTEPGVDQHRLTAAAIYNLPLNNGANLSMTAAFGRNILKGKNSDAFLAEATYERGPTSIFARWEHVTKDELQGIPAGDYTINKFLIGGVRDVAKWEGLNVGIGAYAGFYGFPDTLRPFYGRSPMTLGAFVRIRP